VCSKRIPADSGGQALENTVLFDKIYGSMLAGAIGDAMGGPVEGWHYEQIVAKHGVVQSLLPYSDSPDYHAHFETAPGTVTDDTRLKHLLCQAILACGGLPRRGDLVKACADAYYAAQTDLERGFLEEYVLAGMYGDAKLIWGGQPTNGFIMANSPLGLICACDPEAAFALSYEVDFISDGYAKYSAALAAAAVAAAMAPGATVDSVIGAALAACQAHRVEGDLTRRWHWYDHVFCLNERLIGTAVEVAARHRDVFAVRAEYYRSLQVSCLGSEAAQTLAVALGMLVAAGGDLRQAIIGCVNYGRDNDSYATVAGAIVGALHGTKAIPADWRATVEAANPEPDMRRLSFGLAQVALRRYQHMSAAVNRVERLLQSSGG
jgi:ADP-ribosylglycohydrolase